MNINRTIIKGLWLSVFTCYVIKTEAQQIPLYSQYFYNQLIYNPAQTGLAEAPHSHLKCR
jgi:hypothetical protein